MQFGDVSVRLFEVTCFRMITKETLFSSPLGRYPVSMPSLSLAIPAYNEEASIEGTVWMYLGALRRATNDFEIILLDDGSTDRSRTIIDRLAAEHPGIIRTVYHERNQGIACACKDVQLAAQKEFVLLLGADGQYAPSVISACLGLAEHCDLVLCKRKEKHYGFYRATISYLYRLLCHLCFGFDLQDPGGVKMVRRSLLDAIPIRSRSVFQEPERVIRAAWGGFRIGIVEVECNRRLAGKARGGNMRLVLSAFRDLCLLWWEDCFLRRVRHLFAGRAARMQPACPVGNWTSSGA